MSKTPGEGDQLRKLERWRTLELEHAQLDHAVAAAVADQHQQQVRRAESEIADVQTFARAQLAGSESVSPDALRRINEFAALQSQELDKAKSVLTQSQQFRDAALGEVVNRFEDLSVIERLRERREIEAGKELARREQKLLDEHALAHLAEESSGSKRE